MKYCYQLERLEVFIPRDLASDVPGLLAELMLTSQKTSYRSTHSLHIEANTVQVYDLHSVCLHYWRGWGGG
jgi:hypothetical protein